MSIDMAQFHQVFFEESFEGLDAMESGLLDLNLGEPDVEEVNSIFRAAHSIKGGSGTFGFKDISDFTHVMETLLDEMRDGRRDVTQEAVDVLLGAVDCLREMMTAVSEGGESDAERVQEHQTKLEELLAAGNGGSAGAAAAADESAGASGGGINGWHVVFSPHRHLLKTGNDPLRLLRGLGDLGDLSVTCDPEQIPSFSDFDPEECYLSWDLVLLGAVEKEAVEDIFDWVEDDADMAIMPISNSAEEPAAPAAESAPAEEAPQAQAPAVAEVTEPPAERRKTERRSSAKSSSGGSGGAGGGSIRVGIDKIDQLINMVGELVITQSMLGMLGEEFEMSKLEKLRDGLAQLERHTREMQESVMRIRMLPISFTFSRFPRLVHDLSSKMGKQIELKMSGENTEVDKTVIEKIGDPLVHLVRNSLDHGIEMPEDRIAKGKPEMGTVHLNAYHKGGNIIIEISDDGKGLPADKLLSKAVERGLVSPDANLTESQIYDLIFLPGFSTAEKLSDVSGRGVGMDVVRKNIQALGGGIEIESEMDVGTTFTIRLPLTLAILDGQTVQVGDELYIVPLVSIIESIQIEKNMINLVAGRGEVFKLREEYLPIVRLYEAFGVEDAKSTKLEEGLLVVVESDGRKCGLFVDDLQGQQQVVIKSLEANYRRIDGVSGATILGDGSVALILDIPGLMRLSNQNMSDPVLMSA